MLPKKIKILISACIPVVVFASFFVTNHQAQAARIFIDSPKASFASGEEFIAQIFVDTEGETLNAVEGSISIPADLLTVNDVRDGNSIVNFWVEKPHNDQTNSELFFSGITPGGFSGSKEYLFSVVMKTAKTGKGVILGKEIKALINDGRGTPAETTASPFHFSVAGEYPSSIAEETVKDKDSPETFKPIISSDPNLYDNQYFLVFATQDKNSGISHYQVREGWLGRYHPATSPYLLKNQTLDKKIFVKAFDKSGNTKIAEVPAQNSKPWYKKFYIFAIILLIAVLIISTRKKWKRKFRS